MLVAAVEAAVIAEARMDEGMLAEAVAIPLSFSELSLSDTWPAAVAPTSCSPRFRISGESLMVFILILPSSMYEANRRPLSEVSNASGLESKILILI